MPTVYDLTREQLTDLLGLQGMRDRLDAIAGKLAVESAPEHGTTITGTVP